MTETIDAVLQPFLSELDPSAVRYAFGGRIWIRAGSEQTGGAFCLMEQIMPPGMGSPYHVHANEDETFYVLEGHLRFFSGGQTRVLGPGGVAFLPRGIAHGFRTEGTADSRSLLLASPGGFEAFVVEMSTPEPPAGPPDMGVMLATAARHGLQILGPLPE